jgi:hypothetical protein
MEQTDWYEDGVDGDPDQHHFDDNTAWNGSTYPSDSTIDPQLLTLQAPSRSYNNSGGSLNQYQTQEPSHLST